MATAINKRQQARNERTLQDLIKDVPGNGTCADCSAKNPGWASWSLGIFLCMRCAALHRKLGTHISKVKSLSMDSWSVDQVDNMKRIGNTASNKIFNPRNTKPAIPIDVDEVDGVMERFIRQKYQQKTLSSSDGNYHPTRQDTGSTTSDDRAPPPPPKPTKSFRFGLRSATANFPLSRQERSPPLTPVSDSLGNDRSPPRSKHAKVLGVDVGSSRDDNLRTKLDQLREMGFPDEKRNTAVLKGLNGRLDKAVEELIRLGEGANSNRQQSRSGLASAPREDGSNGLTVERSRPPALSQQRPVADVINFEKSLPPSPMSPDATNFNRTVSPSQHTNPFMAQKMPQQPTLLSLDQSMRQLQLTQQPSQPPSSLFPHSTGGPSQHYQATNPFMQTYTPPPMPSQQNGYGAAGPFPPPLQVQSTPGVQQTQQTNQPLDQSNPFLRSTKSQTFTPFNPFQQQQGMTQTTPDMNFWQSPQPPVQSQVHSDVFGSGYIGQLNSLQSYAVQPPAVSTNIPSTSTGSNGQLHQSQGQVYSSPNAQNLQIPMTTSPPPLGNNGPFAQSQSSPPIQQYHSPSYPFGNGQPSYQTPTFTGAKHDKTSILSLYSVGMNVGPASFNSNHNGGPNNSMTGFQPTQRSVTMPPGIPSVPPAQSPAPQAQTVPSTSGADLFGSASLQTPNLASTPFPNSTNGSPFTNGATSPFSGGANPFMTQPSTEQPRSQPQHLQQPQTHSHYGSSKAQTNSPFAINTTFNHAPSPFTTSNVMSQVSSSSPFGPNTLTTPSSASPFASHPGASPFGQPKPSNSPFGPNPSHSLTPFGTSNNPPFAQQQKQPQASNPMLTGFRHASNESVDFVGLMNANGRHSPDAFASLSSRLR